MTKSDQEVAARAGHHRRDLIRFFEGVLRDMEDDPEVIAHEPIEEVEAYLREHGLEKEPFFTMMQEIISRSGE